LANTLEHEFTHNQQQNLIVRSIADDLNIGKSANGEEFAKLKEQCREKYGRVPEDKELEKILQARDGKRLSEPEEIHALELRKAFKENAPPGARMDQIASDMHMQQSALDHLADQSHPDAAKDVLYQLSSTDPAFAREHSRQLFGSENPPQQVQELIDKFKRGEALPADANDQLTKAIQHGMDNNRIERAAINEQYLGVHEQEAWAIGQLAEQGHGRKSPVRDDVEVNAPDTQRDIQPDTRR